MSIANIAAVAVAVAAIAGGASAQVEQQLTKPEAVYSIQATPTYGILTAVVPVNEADLAALSGGAEMVAVTNQNLTALNSGNSVNATSVVNGSVTLDPNAFSGFSGLGNFVINTGNNNNLQGSMSINIIMTPP